MLLVQNQLEKSAPGPFAFCPTSPGADDWREQGKPSI